jgi:hypothetical protein
MNRRIQIWQGIASLFAAANFGGAGFAVAGEEWMHASIHVGLALLAWYYAWRLGARDRHLDLPADFAQFADRFERLQQAVDSIAVEVERIGEGQRFAAKLLAEQARVRSAALEEGRAAKDQRE